MMRLATLTITILLINISTYAQVSQRIIAEHFTNTLCSNCARHNPGLITNFTNNPDVLHISVHPSSPYSACVLNQHNKTDNDTRTRLYNLYGSTPRLAINGMVYSGAFSNTAMFDPYKNMTTEVEVSAQISKKGSDSVMVSVELETKATHSYGSEKIFVVLVEDTVFYNAPNGEKQHYNVLRDALTSSNGDAIQIKSNVGEKSSLTYTAKIHGDWQQQRMRAIVMVQKSSDNGLIQSFESSVIGSGGQVGIQLPTADEANLLLYPNPSNGQVSFESTAPGTITVFNASGQIVLSESIQETASFNWGDLNHGIYHVVFQSNDGEVTTQKLIMK